jgi:hypothetical protein
MALFLRLPLSEPSGEDASHAEDKTDAAKKEDRVSKNTPEGAKKTARQEQNSGVKAKEPELEGPWFATRRFFHSREDPGVPKLEREDEPSVDFTKTTDIRLWSGTSAPQLATFFGIDIAEKSKITWITAIVPDPLHTRLSLFTDSSIGAILQAAAAMQWEFAGQWMPWYDTVNSDEKDPDKRREQRKVIGAQEKQPGILIFRHFDKKDPVFDGCVLIVFLVGETPTTGVNPDQFLNARAYMRAINDTAPVLIQGPTFTGSLDSLATLIDQDRSYGLHPGNYVVRSGTVTSRQHQAAFLKGRSFVCLSSATNDSRTQECAFRRTIQSMGVPESRAAILFEDESAYGAAVRDAVPGPDCPGVSNEKIRAFPFPRDISHLRNVYRDVDKGGKQPVPEINFSLKDAQTGEDAAPTFSAAHSPLSQDALMNQIVNAIHRERIRLVELSATNVLDTLFLAKLLRRQCPDTRILLASPDILFVEEAKTESLNGTLALSTYPLFYHTGGQRETDHRLFTDANSQGVFNSMVLALQQPTDDPKQPALIDYGLPNLPQRPTWLLTLDREGFLPVRVWRPAPDKPSKRGSVNSPFEFVQLKPPATWTAIAGIAFLLTVAFVATTAWVSTHDRTTFCSALSWDNRPTGGPADQRDGWRVFYAALMLACLLAIGVLLWPPQSAGVIWTSIGIAFVALASVVLTRMILVLSQNGAKRPAWSIATVVAGLLALGVFWRWNFCPRELGMNFFYYRALEFRLGSSPLWPLLSAIGALVLFCYCQKTRIYLAVRQAPEVLTPGDNSVVSGHLGWAAGELQFSLDAAYRPCIRRHGWLLAAAGVLCACAAVIATVWEQVSTIDGRCFNVTLMAIEGALVVTILLTCSQVLTLWYLLRCFLSALEPLPFVTAFIRPERTGDRRPLWVRWLNLESLDVFYRTAVILHDLGLANKPVAHWQLPENLGGYLGNYKKDLQDILDPNKSRHATLTAAKSLRRINHRIAAAIFQTAATGLWKGEQLLRAALAPASAEKSISQSTGDHPLYTIRGDPREGRDLMHALLALHYTPYLLYVVRQIQNLMWYLPAGFVLLTFSLTSYGLQSPRFIGRCLLLLFLLIGFVLWRCMSGMERDMILSRIAGSNEGELNPGFYLKFLSYGALPALTLLASEFPSISNFLYSWVEPTVKALH